MFATATEFLRLTKCLPDSAQTAAMDLSFARRRNQSAKIDLGTLLAQTAVDQSLTSTARIQAHAEAPVKHANPGEPVVGMLVSGWQSKPDSKCGSFNRPVAQALLTAGQRL